MPAPDAYRSPLDAIGDVPAGRWGVAVSGGADSVALLRLAAARADLAPHVIHLDHQTRGAESAADADFVRRLAGQLGLPATVATRAEVETSLAGVAAAAVPQVTANPSARYRAARLALFRRVAVAEGLAGVLLAHHADDQAETVMLRLLRGAGYPALAGMAGRSEVAGVTLVRPLLRTRRADLRAHLAAIGQDWREDASNAGDAYARNRVRRALTDRPELVPALLRVGSASAAAAGWVEAHAPELPAEFATAVVADLPEVVARAATAAWLRRRGVPADAVAPAHVAAVVAMCRDAAGPSRHAAPGGVTVRRRKGRVGAE